MSLIKRAYKYRCEPTAEQRLALARTFGCCRWVYNQALARKTAAYREAGQRLSYSDLSALLPGWKTQVDTTWLGEVSSVPLQQSLRHLDRAFGNFFEGRAKYPKFKKRHGPQAATPILIRFQRGISRTAFLISPTAIAARSSKTASAKPAAI